MSEFDTADAREAWDRAADPYTRGQETGRDYYRHEFFGPAQVAMCGDVRGLRVLDLGSGSGYLARELARRGARVTGVDLSPRMIEHARRREAAEPLGVEYVVDDAAEVAARFAPESFDLAVSCMALQDMPAPDAVLRAARAVLRPAGRLVASITHPCTDTPFRQWERGPDGAKRWLCVDRYFERATLRYAWRWEGEEFTTPAVHATLEDWVTWILGAGFRLCALREPRPTADAIGARPDLADAARVPYYVMFDLAR
jgi:SAM-dependent methyltransferase